MKLDVTVAITVRETFSKTISSLETILKHTPKGVRYVYVASGMPNEIFEELEQISKNYDMDIVRVDHFLTPNQARNTALKEVKTKYVAFVDNDVFIRDNWLEALVKCAEEEEATIVAPLIFEKYPLWKYVHIAGGETAIREPGNGDRICHQLPYHLHHDNVKEPKVFKRTQTELVEFHVVLVETDFLNKNGGLDDKILCMFEEWDMCLQALRQDKKIFLEPASEIAYLAPYDPSVDDIRLFDLRWSEKWLEGSVRHLIEKHDLTPRTGNLRIGKNFVKIHRLHKYGKFRKQLSNLFGQKIASVFMHRLVSNWDKYQNHRKTEKDYKKWKQYTDSVG